MINLKNIKKTYEGKVPTEALKGVSFEIQEGEFVGLMGRSGSGKSTLLHQLGLLDTPTEGDIFLDGINMCTLSDEQKALFRLTKIGYIFQEYGLIKEFTALENVYLPSMALNDKEGKKRATELLEFVGLKKRLFHYPDEMSGGEQQRVAIARALINEPKIIFADEPTANLDSISTEVVLALFEKLNKELKKTIVMVTHESTDKKYMSRVITLKDGLLENSSLTSTSSQKNSSVLRPF